MITAAATAAAEKIAATIYLTIDSYWRENIGLTTYSLSETLSPQIPKGTGEWSSITIDQKNPLQVEIYFDASCFILKIHMNFEFYFIIYWYLF